MRPANFAGLSWQPQIRTRRKNFYAALFGWTARDVPIGSGDIYSLFELEGALRPPRSLSVPAKARAACRPTGICMWRSPARMQAAKKAGGMGGKVVEAPFDVVDRGRAA